MVSVPELTVRLARRRFLVAGLTAVGFVTSGAWRLGLGRGGWRYLRTAEAALIVAVARTWLPRLDEILAYERLPDYLDRYFERLDVQERWLLRGLFLIVDQGSLLAGHLQPARRLPPQDLAAYLAILERGRWPLVRRLADALRSVVGMAIWSHPAALARLGVSPACRSRGESLWAEG